MDQGLDLEREVADIAIKLSLTHSVYPEGTLLVEKMKHALCELQNVKWLELNGLSAEELQLGYNDLVLVEIVGLYQD